MTQIAKVAVAAATYAIDKPYDYLVPSGMELSGRCPVYGSPFPSGGATAPPRAWCFSCGRRCLPSP